MIEFNIVDITTKKQDKNFILTEDGIADLMVTTEEGYSLIIYLLFDRKEGTIKAMSPTIVNGFCPLCRQEKNECKEVDDPQNKMEITQKIHNWFKANQYYRLHFLVNGYDKFKVVK